MSTLLQFTLGLFETRPELPQVAKPKAPKSPKPKTRRAKTPESSTNLRSDQQAALDLWAPAQSSQYSLHTDTDAVQTHSQTQTLEQALVPETFCHPRASRETHLAGTLVAYEFKRGKRRTIGFSVGPEGLAVRAPKWVPLLEVDKAVLDKSAWILQKLQETRQRHQRLQSARIDWKDGARLPYLGGMVRVVLDPRHGIAGAGAELAELQLAGTGEDSGELLELRVSLPLSASADQIRDVVQAWLMCQAQHNFVGRLNHFGPQLGVSWRKFSLSSAGTRWGSASSVGSIRLNWHLIHLRQVVIDYVVVHELSHLRVMNHSPQFWETVREVVPDFSALRAELKSDAIPQW